MAKNSLTLQMVGTKQPGPFDKVWNKTHYGTEKGK